MFLVNYRTLLKRLNPLCTQALEAAAGLAINRGHYEITVEHMLLKLVDDASSDIAFILKSRGLPVQALGRNIQRNLDRRRSGNTGRPVFSPILVTWFQDAWLMGSVESGAEKIRSGHLLAVLAAQPEHYEAMEYNDFFKRLDKDALRTQLDEIAAGSSEKTIVKKAGAGAAGGEGEAAEGGAEEEGAPARQRTGDSLDKYTTDMTEMAREGKLDPCLGRDREIRQMVDILCRRKKNNPIVVGESGVGKTAVVEGLALRVAAGEVPDALKDVEIRNLDLGLLQAGAGVKGEFEARLTGVINEIKGSTRSIILFIDEAHMIIGAGAGAGGGDAANLLKPALARGELRTVAATTWSEYKKYFEKDAALSRRFQVVKVGEPDRENALVMLRAIAGKLRKAHGIHIRDDAVEAAVDLSARYISGRLLPDKAVDLLDTCAARVKVMQSSYPGNVEEVIRRHEALEREREAVLEDLALTGETQGRALDEIEAALKEIAEERQALESRWQAEKDAASAVLALRKTAIEARGGEEGAPEGAKGAAKPEATPEAPKPEPSEPGAKTGDFDWEAPPTESSGPASELKAAIAHLETLQAEEEMVPLEVDVQVVSSVVADWTGIPVGKMVKDDVSAVTGLKDSLEKRIKGQDPAIQAIAKRIQNARAGLQDPRQPIGVFLLVGPSGTGKTESALAVADTMFGGERFVVTVNMSEFQEKHTVSKLIGSPPGYVGYGEGGVLTEAVRQRPYSVVLLDEIEKADPEVLNLFYQVFDKGTLADGEGRVVDFANTVIFLTTNLGTDTTMKMASSEEGVTYSELEKALRPELSRYLKPALLARMTVVPYFPLPPPVLRQIVKLKLRKVVARMMESHDVKLVFDESVVGAIADRCNDVDTGARNADHIIREYLLPVLAARVLTYLAEETLPEVLSVRVGEKGKFEVVAGELPPKPPEEKGNEKQEADAADDAADEDDEAEIEAEAEVKKAKGKKQARGKTAKK